MAYEDLSAYTETDPYGHISKTASRVTVTDMGTYGDSRVSKDEGADFFGATFKHDFTFSYIDYYSDIGDAVKGTSWAVSNTLDDTYGWDSANNQALHAMIWGNALPGPALFVRNEESGASDYFNYGNYHTLYYTAERTSETAFELRIYSDAARTTLLDTLTLAITTGRRYRYVFAANSYNSGDEDNKISFYTENLDLNLGAAPQTLTVTGIAGAEALGTPSLTLKIAPSGIASAEAFGQPTLTLRIAPSGIATTEALGTPSLTMKISPSGIASEQAVGEPALTLRLAPAGIAGGEAFGSAQFNFTISPPGIASEQAVGTPDASGKQTIVGVGIASAEALGTPALTLKIAPSGIASAAAFGTAKFTTRLAPSGIASGQAVGSPDLTGTLTVVVATGIASAEALGEPQILHVWPVSIDIPELNGTRRRLTWGTEDEVRVMLDGILYQRASGGYCDIDESKIVRQYIEVAEEERLSPITPLDRAALAWSATGISYEVWRRLDGGEWVQLAETSALSFIDGPLEDVAADYEIIALDDKGNESLASSVASVAVSSAPEPPTGLDFSWDAETLTLTLSWTASTSADIATYRVRSNGGAGPILLTSAPVQDSAALTYLQVFVAETGLWLFSVHAVDTSGQEEANVSQVVGLSFEAGAPAALPAWPLRVKAEAIAGGKVRVSWWYRPDQEYLGPGAAFEARIYYDNATGTVDYATPLDTLAMGAPEDPDVWEWTSDALVDDQEYLFVVRIATAAHPGGVETQNTDEHAATPDSSVPDAPVLTAALV